MAGYWYADSRKIKALGIIVLLVIIPLILSQITLGHLAKAPSLCIYKNLTRKDCWGCGTSRALVSIMHLNFPAAYAYNKRIVIIFPLLVYLWLKYLLRYIKQLIQIV
jgi:hypothetical protein